MKFSEKQRDKVFKITYIILVTAAILFMQWMLTGVYSNMLLVTINTVLFAIAANSIVKYYILWKNTAEGKAALEKKRKKTKKCNHEHWLMDKQIRVIRCKDCGIAAWVDDYVDLFSERKSCSNCLHRNHYPDAKHKYNVNKCEISGYSLTDVENYKCKYYKSIHNEN